MKLIKDLGLRFIEAQGRKRRFGLYECSTCKKQFEAVTTRVKDRVDCRGCTSKKVHIIHGNSSHKLYPTWRKQQSRCENTKDAKYKDYGDRGICFSSEFKDFSVCLLYVSSLPSQGEDKYSIDRIDNNLGYERGNLRWASQSTQACNKRINKNNSTGYRGVVEFKGKYKASIFTKGKKIHLGYFDTAKEGAYVRDAYIIEHGLENARNFTLGD